MIAQILLPMRREQLAEKARLDAREERDASLRETPSERLLLALELSDLTRGLAVAAKAPWLGKPRTLESKARLYVAPLRAVADARE